MYVPHTVTLYNRTRVTDPTTFVDVDTYYITILNGVFLDASKGANVRDTGLAGADAVNLYIPLNVAATDAITGAQKEYIAPLEFHALTDKSGYWTLTDDRNTFFAKGVVVEVGKDEDFINAAHDDVYSVTRIDLKDYGSPFAQHWEIGGN